MTLVTVSFSRTLYAVSLSDAAPSSGSEKMPRSRRAPTSPMSPTSQKSYYAYIMGSLSGTLYIGVTSNLHKRVFQHKFHRVEGFTDKYRVERLLYWESFDEVARAINREKQLKGWKRSKKIALIESLNPHWLDLARDWYPWMTSSGVSRGASTPPDDSLRSSSDFAQHDNEERDDSRTRFITNRS